MSNLENLRHLLFMAAADGGVSIEELRLLGDRAVRWGVTDDEFEALLEAASRGDNKLQMPSAESDKNQLLKDLVRMMAADGEIHASEKKLFAVIATQMGISEERLNHLIDATIAEGPA